MFPDVLVIYIRAKMESCGNHERCRHRNHGASVLLQEIAVTEEIREGKNGMR